MEFRPLRPTRECRHPSPDRLAQTANHMHAIEGGPMVRRCWIHITNEHTAWSFCARVPEINPPVPA